MDGLSVQKLQEKARRAFEQFSGSQQDLADILGVDRSTVSRAVRKAGRKHAAVQARIISYVKAVPVQRRSTYQGRHVRHEWVVGP
ncbi:MAG: antitoxin Xre-like helix-turn-helix domain-containing protein [Salinibacter sp.]